MKEARRSDSLLTSLHFQPLVNKLLQCSIYFTTFFITHFLAHFFFLQSIFFIYFLWFSLFHLDSFYLILIQKAVTFWVFFYSLSLSHLFHSFSFLIFCFSLGTDFSHLFYPYLLIFSLTCFSLHFLSVSENKSLSPVLVYHF